MEFIFIIILFTSLTIGWIKMGARDDMSRHSADIGGSLTYRDCKGIERLISNNHPVKVGNGPGIYLRECDNDGYDNRYYQDLKTKTKIFPAKERAKQLLTERLQKAREIGSNEMIFVQAMHTRCECLNWQQIRECRLLHPEQHMQKINGCRLDEIIHGNCYCEPTMDIDASIYDHTYQICNEDMEQMYVVKSIAKCETDHWRLDFYMSIETGLLYKPTEAQLKMEQFIRDNLGPEYKSFSDEELQEFMDEFNEEQLKRQMLALELAKAIPFVDDIAKIYYNNTSSDEREGLSELRSKKYMIFDGDKILLGERYGYLKHSQYDFTDKTPYMREVENRRY